MPRDILQPHLIVDARERASKPLLLQGSIEGHVLVKNAGSLPLPPQKMISIFDYDAKAPDVYNVGPVVAPWLVGFNSGNWTAAGSFFMGQSNNNTINQNAPFGTVFTGGGAAAATPPYISSPFEAFSQRAYDDDTVLLWDFNSNSPQLNAASTACLVFINAMSQEILDRPGLRDAPSDLLVNNVADQCSNTIVVVHNAGTRLVDSFVDHPNVTAIVYAHLPGQDSGRALVSLLYGDSNFSGKLTYTVAKNESDYGKLLDPDIASSQYALYPQSEFREGRYIDYRHFDKYNIEPRYEFGFGLSYTRFSYKNIKIDRKRKNLAVYPTGPVESGGQKDLWDILYEVTADIKNIGDRDGAEVAQLYVGVPGGPIRQLRGFQKVEIKKGRSTKVSFELRRRDLSDWDVIAQKWRLQRGTYKVWVGESSRKLILEGEIRL